MEIKDSEGAVQYRRTFPYIEAKEDYFESWSVSALLLTGTNGTGLLVSYEVYSEPSAPEEEPTGWFQVFGVVNGKFIPFGAPLVKKDFKVALLTARVATRWVEGNAAGPSANSKGLIDDAGGFGVAADTDLWLKVRIDGKEGWMHSEEDFRALGLPED